MKELQDQMEAEQYFLLCNCTDIFISFLMSNSDILNHPWSWSHSTSVKNHCSQDLDDYPGIIRMWIYHNFKYTSQKGVWWEPPWRLLHTEDGGAFGGKAACLGHPTLEREMGPCPWDSANKDEAHTGTDIRARSQSLCSPPPSSVAPLEKGRRRRGQGG